MALKVNRVGLFSIIQDLGRTGYQKYGILVNGGMDSYALCIANILVGNSQNEACLEIALWGPSIEFTEDAVIAVAGAEMSASVNGERINLMQPVAVRKGSVLDFGTRTLGCLAYLAVAGGFDVPRIMGSKSTYLRAKFGGFCGRGLAQGDEIPVGSMNSYGKRLLSEIPPNLKHFSSDRWFKAPPILKKEDLEKPIRITRGKQYDAFSEESKKMLENEWYLITKNSDRMGYRLEGAPIKLSSPLELISEPTCTGTVQVPPDGQPIILMADCQTVGGYPKIGQVIKSDIRRIAQRMAGEYIKFELVTVEEAENILIDQREYINAFEKVASVF